MSHPSPRLPPPLPPAAALLLRQPADMEELFMQAFERRDWVVSQMRQQVDSHAQSIACALAAAGHRPPPWLLPPGAGEPRELNGKPIVSDFLFPGSRITTPATNRTSFQPPAFPSGFFRNTGVPNEYTQLETNSAAQGNDQHEESQQKQASAIKEPAKASPEINMFSRIKRSRSRQRNIEDRLSKKDQAANSGSSAGMQDRMQRSRFATVGSNRTSVSLSSQPCGDGVNNAATTSSSPGHENDFDANHGRPTESLKNRKCGDIENQGDNLECSPCLVLQNQTSSSDKNGKVPNNSSVGNLQTVQVSDSVCHPLPETHLSVEPKKLQFDCVESVCISPSCEQMMQQPMCALGTAHLGLAGTHPLHKDPSSSSCSQAPHLMDESLLDSVDCGYLSPGSAPVKEHWETRNSMRTSLGKDTEGISGTNSLEGPCSKVIPPLVKERVSSVETDCFDMMLERGTVLPVEDAERMKKLGGCSDRIITGNSESHEQQYTDSHVLHPPYCRSLQLPTQVFDTSSGAPASAGILLDSLLENGCDDISHSLIDDSNNQCSDSEAKSASCQEQLPPQSVNSGDVCHHSSSKTQSNGRHFNDCPVVNASISSENELSQEQYLLTRPSLEFNGNAATVDTPLSHLPLGTGIGMLNGKPASDAAKCCSGNLGDIQIKLSALNEACDVSVRNRKNESVVPEAPSSNSARRTSMTPAAERNSIISTGKCTGSLQQHETEQGASLFENAVEINPNSFTAENNKHLTSLEKINLLNSTRSKAASDQKRSGADGVQVNGALSCKRRKTTGPSDIALSSSCVNSLSWSYQQAGISGQMSTVANFSEKSQPSGRYFLRSSKSCGRMSIRSEGRSVGSRRKEPIATDVDENGDSSPGRGNEDTLPDDVLHNSRAGSSMAAILGRVSENSQSQLQNNLEIEFATRADDMPSCSNTLSCHEEHCAQEEKSTLEGQDLNVTNLSDEQMSHQMDDMSSQRVLFNPENHSGMKSPTTSGREYMSSGRPNITAPTSYNYDRSDTIYPSYAVDQCGEQASASDASVHEKLSNDSNVELDRKCFLSGAAIPSPDQGESVDYDDAMPEFESFDVPVQFDSPTFGERTLEALYGSEPVTFSSDLAKKYHINTEGGENQLLPTVPGNPTNCSFPDDLHRCSTSNGNITMDIFGACGYKFDDSFFISDAIASCPSNANTEQENIENPLTPSVDKYSMGKLSAKAGSGSEHMGSIPELECFRIDEDSSIADEDQQQDILPGSVVMNYSNQCPSDRKALQDITVLFQNTEKSASLSTEFLATSKIDLTAETCSSKLNDHSNIRNYQNSKKRKENHATSVKREGKFSQSLHDGLSRRKILNDKNERNRSEANLDKLSKPSNVVANVTSFLPLVKPKPQPAPTFGKKDVRVKALEAADAAKRLEEQKRSEREMRKAAAKIERERLKQEKELKEKKEEEQKKKREADMAIKKRQREEEERREKERKRRCIDEARKQQKPQKDRRHAMNNEKDARRKASDNNELKKNFVDDVESQVKHDETTKSSPGVRANKSDNDKGVALDARPPSFGSHGNESISNSIDKSYIMSPYKDSDDEDYDDFEHEQESRRRRKLIPSWARKENLDKILLSNQRLDPREIFGRKCSFNLSDVLSAHIPQRGFR